MPTRPESLLADLWLVADKLAFTHEEAVLRAIAALGAQQFNNRPDSYGSKAAFRWTAERILDGLSNPDSLSVPHRITHAQEMGRDKALAFIEGILVDVSR